MYKCKLVQFSHFGSSDCSYDVEISRDALYRAYIAGSHDPLAVSKTKFTQDVGSVLLASIAYDEGDAHHEEEGYSSTVPKAVERKGDSGTWIWTFQTMMVYMWLVDKYPSLEQRDDQAAAVKTKLDALEKKMQNWFGVIED